MTTWYRGSRTITGIQVVVAKDGTSARLLTDHFPDEFNYWDSIEWGEDSLACKQLGYALCRSLFPNSVNNAHEGIVLAKAFLQNIFFDYWEVDCQTLKKILLTEQGEKTT